MLPPVSQSSLTAPDAISVTIVLPVASPPAGTPTSVPVKVKVSGDNGHAIIPSAAYRLPVVLTDADHSGKTKLSINGGPGKLRVTLRKPRDSVKLLYNGQNIGFAALTASVSRPHRSKVSSFPAYFMPHPVLVKTIGTTVAGTISAFSSSPDP